MQRLASSDSGFWTTIDLLIERNWRDRRPTGEDLKIELQEINQKKISKLRRSSRVVIQESFSGTKEEYGAFGDSFLDNLENSGRMQRLHDDLRHLAEDALQKRIAARKTNEIERLKKIFLNGKSPLKDCPPELHEHPVFLFWRVIEKEVDRLANAKSDAYYKKLRPRRKAKSSDNAPSSADSEQTCTTPESIMHIPKDIIEGTLKQKNPAENKKFKPLEFNTGFRYEDESVKELKELLTVEELYKMADQIIGTPQEEDPKT